MKKREKIWEPLGEANAQWIVNEKGQKLFFKNDLTVLGICEQVEIDVNMLLDLCFMGGIEELYLGASNEGFENNKKAIILGHDESGNAYGGFASGKAMTHNSDNKDLGREFGKARAKSSLKLTFNQDGLRDEVMRSKGGLRSPQEWSKVMDREIKEGIEKIAVPFMMRPSKREMAAVTFAIVLSQMVQSRVDLPIEFARLIVICNILELILFKTRAEQDSQRRDMFGHILGVELLNVACWYYQAKTKQLVDELIEEEEEDDDITE